MNCRHNAPDSAENKTQTYWPDSRPYIYMNQSTLHLLLLLEMALIDFYHLMTSH